MHMLHIVQNDSWNKLKSSAMHVDDRILVFPNRSALVGLHLARMMVGLHNNYCSYIDLDLTGVCWDECMLGARHEACSVVIF